MDEWMDSLRRADGALRPDGGALGRVRAEVRRRRRRRAAVTGIAAAASVALVIGGVAVAVQGGDRPRDRVAVEPTATPPSHPTDPTAPTPRADPTAFTCPTENPVFTEDAPTLDNDTMQAYKRTYAEITTRDFEGFSLHRTEIFHAGVFVLVTGDLATARRTLTPYGVTGVGPWDPDGPSVGLDEYAQLEQLIHGHLDPVLNHVKQASRRIGGKGSAGFAYWPDANAILVQWKRPVPAEIRALEDTQFKSGGEVIVRAVRWSRSDVDAAQRELHAWLRGNARRDSWSSASACGDFSGLVVGMTPESLDGTDRGALQAEIAGAVGMPVMVVPEEKPVDG